MWTWASHGPHRYFWQRGLAVWFIWFDIVLYDVAVLKFLGRIVFQFRIYDMCPGIKIGGKKVKVGP